MAVSLKMNLAPLQTLYTKTYGQNIMYLLYNHSCCIQVLCSNSLIPCSRVLLEKLTGPQLVTKYLTFYGTQFITAFTRALHLPIC